MTALDADFALLKDWKLLLFLNDLSHGDVDGKLPDPQHAADWMEQAKRAVTRHISELDLPFDVPDVREILLLWPHEKI